MKSFLLILSVIFGFGIVLTSSSISYSDHITTINSTVYGNQENKDENEYYNKSESLTYDNNIQVINEQVTIKNH